MVSVGTQLDLFGEAEARLDYVSRLEAFRASLHVDCCTGEPIPPFMMGDYPLARVRCGRCGETVREGLADMSHDLGWLGCPGHDYEPPPFRQLTAEQMCERHDSRHHEPCGRCGHPWGIHDHHFGLYLPEESWCMLDCGCEGYVAP